LLAAAPAAPNLVAANPTPSSVALGTRHVMASKVLLSRRFAIWARLCSFSLERIILFDFLAVMHLIPLARLAWMGTTVLEAKHLVATATAQFLLPGVPTLRAATFRAFTQVLVCLLCDEPFVLC
jgi:hypothetical protein